MRKINTSDVFKFSRIITTSGMKDELKAMYAEADKSNVESFGLDAIFRILGAATTEAMERELYGFWGDIVGRTADEVANEDIDTLMDEMKQVSEENDLPRFFKAAVKLIR